MPQQEVFFAQQAGDRRIEVLKTYDKVFAREVFAGMDRKAQTQLWTSLGIADNHDSGDIPQLGDPEGEEFLWEELLDAAREDGNLLSFFVVTSSAGTTSTGVYVSPDWPSAESVAKSLIPDIH